MVTVVVPIYNTEKYIRPCIDSIIHQSYSNLQIILVDDGSTDQSGEICDIYAELDDRIGVIHKKNGGLSDARNAGIDMARGEYITFIDADDFIARDMIDNLLRVAISEDADMVACKVIRCEESDTPDMIDISNSEQEYEIYSGKEKMRIFMQDKKIGTTAWAKLYKTTLFQDIRYPFGKIHEDVYTTYKLIHVANKLCYVPAIGYVYRKNSNGLSRVFSMSRLDAIHGAIERADFIEIHYPELINEAYCKVVNACNNCLMLMGMTKTYDVESLKWMQQLYRQYGKYYIRTRHVSKLGKIATEIASFNIKLAWVLFAYVHKRNI